MRSLSSSASGSGLRAPGNPGAIIPWTLEIKVAHPVRVFPGMVIGKIAFWAMLGAPVQYDGRYVGSADAVASRIAHDQPATPEPAL